MADALDQTDIDALLAAVDSGEMEAGASGDAAEMVFGRRRGGEPADVRVYDFKRPERVSKDQMRSLQTLHEAFARNFGASLSAFLRMIAGVRVASCEQMTYGEFIASLPNPTSFNLIQVSPSGGQICLEISPLIIYPIVDRLLGGNNEELFIPARPLTDIERRLVNQITDRAMTALTESWEDIAELHFEVEAHESNPQLMQIMPPNEVAVVIGFELELSNRAGTMNLCIPYKIIEPLIDRISAQSWARTRGGPDAARVAERLSASLSRAAVQISGLLAETTMTMSDLMNLAPGDVLTTDKPAGAPAVLCVEGEKKHLAHLGQHKGMRALKILRPVRPDDRV